MNSRTSPVLQEEILLPLLDLHSNLLGFRDCFHGCFAYGVVFYDILRWQRPYYQERQICRRPPMESGQRSSFQPGHSSMAMGRPDFLRLP